MAFEISKYTKRTILLTLGGTSAKKNGLYDKITTILKDGNINFIELSGIKANPEVDTARLGAKLIKENNIDFILSIGGGSVLDNTKHMAIASKSELDVWELLLNPNKVNLLTNLPKIGCIMTVAATGSEMNSGGVLSNPEVNEKRAMFHPEVEPVFSYLDPTLLYTLPQVHKQAGVCDTISHLLENYFGDHTDNHFTDRIIESLLLNVINNYELYLTSNDYNAHANIFASATYALNGLTGLGRSASDWASHSIEHEVSAYTDLTHGIGLAIIHPTVINYYYEQDIKTSANLVKFINLGRNVFKLNADDNEVAKLCNDAI